MVLAAFEQGVGSTWVSYFKVEELTEILSLSAGGMPTEIIAFGYPAGEMNSTEKKNWKRLYSIISNLIIVFRI